MAPAFEVFVYSRGDDEITGRMRMSQWFEGSVEKDFHISNFGFQISDLNIDQQTIDAFVKSPNPVTPAKAGVQNLTKALNSGFPDCVTIDKIAHIAVFRHSGPDPESSVFTNYNATGCRIKSGMTGRNETRF
jgi:hypothetical protein